MLSAGGTPQTNNGKRSGYLRPSQSLQTIRKKKEKKKKKKKRARLAALWVRKRKR